MKIIKIPAGTENCLQYLLEKGIEIERQCLEGHCGSCRTIITEGEPSYFNQPLAWIDEGQFLPCCSSAKTDLDIIIK